MIKNWVEIIRGRGQCLGNRNADLERGTLFPLTNSRWFFVMCLVCAIVLRLVVIIAWEADQIADAQWYFDRAVTLAAGLGYRGAAANLSYGISVGQVTAYWPVGYPALLAVLFQIVPASVNAAQMLNVILSVGIVLVTYKLCYRLTGDRAISQYALAIISLFPSQVFSCFVTMSEIPHAFFLLLGILLIYSPIRSPRIAVAAGAASGVSFGFATLMKSQTLLLVPFMVLLAARPLWTRSSRRLWYWNYTVVPMFIALIFTVMPWTIRNYMVFKRFVFVSTNEGINLLIGNNSKATGRYLDPSQITELQSSGFFETEDEVLRSRIARSLAVDHIRNNPKHFLSLVPRKLWYMWGSDLGELNWIYRGMDDGRQNYNLFWHWTMKLIAQGYYLIIVGAACAWIITKVRRILIHRKVCHEPLLMYTVTIVASFSAITVLFFGSPRFHFPMIPFLAICAAAEFTNILRYVTGQSFTGRQSKRDLSE